jgi:UDP-glucose 6-dehydrogenase
LNESFDGSVWHHVNNSDTVAIPEFLHRKCAIRDVEKHRKLVLSYYETVENMVKGQIASSQKARYDRLVLQEEQRLTDEREAQAVMEELFGE